MKKASITTAEFHKYIQSLNLFRIKIWIENGGICSWLTTEPNIKDFTQVYKLNDGSKFWFARLSFKDIENEEITKGFFKTEENL